MNRSIGFWGGALQKKVFSDAGLPRSELDCSGVRPPAFAAMPQSLQELSQPSRPEFSMVLRNAETRRERTIRPADRRQGMRELCGIYTSLRRIYEEHRVFTAGLRCLHLRG